MLSPTNVIPAIVCGRVRRYRRCFDFVQTPGDFNVICPVTVKQRKEPEGAGRAECFVECNNALEPHFRVVDCHHGFHSILLVSDVVHRVCELDRQVQLIEIVGYRCGMVKLSWRHRTVTLLYLGLALLGVAGPRSCRRCAPCCCG
jgi:hypothetical protein